MDAGHLPDPAPTNLTCSATGAAGWGHGTRAERRFGSRRRQPPVARAAAGTAGRTGKAVGEACGSRTHEGARPVGRASGCPPPPRGRPRSYVRNILAPAESVPRVRNPYSVPVIDRRDAGGSRERAARSASPSSAAGGSPSPAGPKSQPLATWSSVRSCRTIAPARCSYPPSGRRGHRARSWTVSG